MSLPCIQEIHAEVYSLSPSDDKWMFREKMKHGLDDTEAARIWWVNHHIRMTSSVHDPCEPSSAKMPPGMHVFASLTTRDELDRAEQELEQLFSEEEAQQTIPVYDCVKDSELKILFAGNDPHCHQMSYQEAVLVLDKRIPFTAEIIRRHMRFIQKLMAIDQHTVDTRAYLTIARYAPESGLNIHVDNVVRTGQSAGPVYTVSLGKHDTKVMDMFPSIEPDQHKPFRVVTPMGSIIMLDGVSRLEWSHGIPKDDPTTRWTIMIKFKQVSDRCVKYCKLLDMPIYESVLDPTLTFQSSQEEDEDEQLITTLQTVIESCANDHDRQLIQEILCAYLRDILAQQQGSPSA